MKRMLFLSSKISQLIQLCLVLPPSGVCKLTHIHELVDALDLPPSSLSRLLLCAMQRSLGDDEELQRAAISVKHFCRVEETKLALANTPSACEIFAECCRRSKSSNARNELARAMANVATVEQGARIFCNVPALEMFRSLVSSCEDNVHEVIGLACAINNITARIALVGLPCCFAGNAGFEIWELLCHCACRESMNDEAREWTARVYINLSLSPQGQCMT